MKLLSLLLRPFFHLISHISFLNSALSLSLSFFTATDLAMSNFFKSVLGAKLGNNPAEQNCTPDQPPYLFADGSKDAVTAGTATLSRAATPGSNSLPPSLHSHDLPCSEKLSYMAICSPAIHQPLKILS